MPRRYATDSDTSVSLPPQPTELALYSFIKACNNWQVSSFCLFLSLVPPTLPPLHLSLHFTLYISLSLSHSNNSLPFAPFVSLFSSLHLISLSVSLISLFRCLEFKSGLFIICTLTLHQTKVQVQNEIQPRNDARLANPQGIGFQNLDN